MNTNYNQFSNVRPDLRQAEKVQSTTGNALTKSVSFTANSASLALDPRNSFLLAGLANLFSSPRGTYHFEPIFGMLQIMAAPVQEPLRIGGGLVGVIGGMLATVVTGTAYTVEWIGRSLQGVSQADAKRQQLMDAFVTRMQQNLLDGYNSKSITYMQKKHFMDNPGQLIGVTTIMVAFLSKDRQGIHTKNGEITRKDIEKMDDNAKQYFKSVCEMKDAIKSFKHHDNYFVAWTALMEKIQNIDINTYDQNEREVLGEIIRISDELSKSVVEDPMFISTWEKFKS